MNYANAISLVVALFLTAFSSTLSLEVYRRSRNKYNDLGDYLFTLMMWMFTSYFWVFAII
jgi:hypothetical protein